MAHERRYKRNQSSKYGISKAKFREKQQEEKERNRNIIPHKIPDEDSSFHFDLLMEQQEQM